MRVVLDTNVLVSGVFFGGIPRALLDAWGEGRYELLVTPSIFDEYIQICERLAATRPSLEYRSVLATIVGHGTLLPDTPVPTPITADPDDDKFMACAAEHRGPRHFWRPAYTRRFWLARRAGPLTSRLHDPPR